jgi:hypothetical protein
VLEAGLYDVTLIDPTYKVQSGNWNDEEHVVAVMRLLDGWRERFEFALLMATHSRKRQVGNGSFSIDDLFGSSAFVRGCEVVLGIQLVEEGVSKLHFLKDRDGALPVRGTVWTLDFDREEGYRISDRPAAGEWVKASPAEIATWVKERGGATPGEILAEFDMGKSALSTRRAELEQHGLRYVSAGAKTRYEPALEPLLPDPPPAAAAGSSAQPCGLELPLPHPPFEAAEVPKDADLQGFSNLRTLRSLRDEPPPPEDGGAGLVEEELDWT